MNRLTIILFAFSCLAFDCTPPAPKPPPVGGVDCKAACENGDAQHLACKALGPDPAGVPCLTWLCQAPVSSKYLACVAGAKSCEIAEACR